MQRLLNPKRRNGYSLVEVLIASALVSVAAMALMSTVNVAWNLKNRKQYSDSIKSYREKVISVINSRKGWTETIEVNSLACLKKDSTGCTSPSLAEIAIVDPDGTKLVGLNGESFGFKSDHTPCPYSDPNCPMRIRVQWQPICESPSTCLNPLIRIVGIAEVNEQFLNYVPNPTAFNFDFIRGANESNAKTHCDSLGGSFDAATGNCSASFTSGSCPQGHIVTGIGSNGAISCEPLLDAECPPSHYANGILPDGTFRCALLVEATTCNTPTGYPEFWSPDPNFIYSTGDGGGDGGGDCGGDGGGGGDCF